jgi:hypothetical protein
VCTTDSHQTRRPINRSPPDPGLRNVLWLLISSAQAEHETI